MSPGGEWRAAVLEARDRGAEFRLGAGELLCTDNYRMLHGRQGFADDACWVVSIWARTSAALAVPDADLTIVIPIAQTVRHRLVDRAGLGVPGHAMRHRRGSLICSGGWGRRGAAGG